MSGKPEPVVERKAGIVVERRPEQTGRSSKQRDKNCALGNVTARQPAGPVAKGRSGPGSPEEEINADRKDEIHKIENVLVARVGDGLLSFFGVEPVLAGRLVNLRAGWRRSGGGRGGGGAGRQQASGGGGEAPGIDTAQKHQG